MSEIGKELQEKFITFGKKYYKRKPTKLPSKRFVQAFWDDRAAVGDDLIGRIFKIPRGGSARDVTRK